MLSGEHTVERGRVAARHHQKVPVEVQARNHGLDQAGDGVLERNWFWIYLEGRANRMSWWVVWLGGVREQQEASVPLGFGLNNWENGDAQLR